MAEILLSASGLTKTFAARPLFENITLKIESGERIGMLGPNGAGKSTLLKILAGFEQPDAGTVATQRGLRIGYLAQDPTFDSRLESICDTIRGSSEPNWESQAKALEIMSKLELEDGPVAKLSGGWKKRVALACELVKEPDLLLLDEPTNHLDVEGILWLEEFLANANFATLTVTHDRVFLQRIANRIFELDRRNPGGLLSVAGDYLKYLETKDALMQAQEQREVILKNTLRRETEWLRRGAKARTTKQQARIKRAGDLRDEVEDLSSRNITKSAQLDFVGTEKNPKRLVEAKHISKAVSTETGDQRVLFSDFSLLLSPGRRVGLLGPNGCGKSTLIQVLVGAQSPDSGTVERAKDLTIAYFAQHREALDPEQTVIETLCPRGEHVQFRGNYLHIRGYLDRFLFRPEQMDMRIKNLSGGEQSRLLIAKLMLQPANVLVLDEPTNDLDTVTLTVLEENLVGFPGAVLFVTHDRYFLAQVATEIISFAPGVPDLQRFASLEQWEAWHRTLAPTTANSRAPEKAKPTSEQPIPKAVKLSFKDKYEWENIEKTIQQAEQELATISAEAADPAIASNPSKLTELTKAMSAAQHKVDHLYARWSELEAMVNAIQK